MTNDEKRVLMTQPHDGHPDTEVCPGCPHPTPTVADPLVEQRRRAVCDWPIIESNRQRDAIHAWVTRGDSSGVEEPHRSLIQAWERRP